MKVIESYVSDILLSFSANYTIANIVNKQMLCDTAILF